MPMNLRLIMRIILITCFALLSWQSYSQTQQFTLDNGLKILVKEDHRAPIATVMVWYDIGSADEPAGLTGVSHVLEHLMFKGTTKYPAGVFSKTISELGGQENAFTNSDFTAYYEKIAAIHLATSFALEADRMQNLLFDQAKFAQEINVIKEERRLRTDNNPQALTFERFLATAHLASPYHHPVIGWRGDLNQMTVNDAKTWYQRYYAPNNAVLVVVGDVDSKNVLTLAKRYFGNLRMHPQPLRKTQAEPHSLGKKTVLVHAVAQVPFIILGFTVPTVKTTPANQNDPYALEILAGILGAGDSCRLTSHLVRGKHLVSTIEVYYNLYARYQTEFVIHGSPTQSHTLAEVKKAILVELQNLQTQKISTKELQRIKTQIIAQKTFEKDSIFGQAMELGLLETSGLGWQTANDYISRIQSITAEQLQDTARRYFQLDRMTEAQLIPQLPTPEKI